MDAHTASSSTIAATATALRAAAQPTLGGPHEAGNVPVAAHPLARVDTAATRPLGDAVESHQDELFQLVTEIFVSEPTSSDLLTKPAFAVPDPQGAGAGHTGARAGPVLPFRPPATTAEAGRPLPASRVGQPDVALSGAKLPAGGNALPQFLASQLAAAHFDPGDGAQQETLPQQNATGVPEKTTRMPAGLLALSTDAPGGSGDSRFPELAVETLSGQPAARGLGQNITVSPLQAGVPRPGAAEAHALRPRSAEAQPAERAKAAAQLRHARGTVAAVTAQVSNVDSGTAAREISQFMLAGEETGVDTAETLHGFPRQSSAGREGHELSSFAAPTGEPRQGGGVAASAGATASGSNSLLSSLASASGMSVADLQASLGNQVGERLIAMATRGPNVAKMQLHPAELGALEIRISMLDEGAVVSINAQQSHTRDAIESGLHKLREMFESEGMQLLDVDVSGSDSDRSTAGEHARADDLFGYADVSGGTTESAHIDTASAMARQGQTRLLDLLA